MKAMLLGPLCFSRTRDQHAGEMCLQVSMKVDEGVKHLVKAEKKQRQSRMVLCIMFLLVAVVICLLLITMRAILF